MTHAPALSAESHDSGHAHGLKLMPFFLALLALTAAEVGLYEWWVRTGVIPEGGTEKVFAIPKFALVLLILIFTLPKAYIVLVYFMHLRFEKAIVVVLAVVPLLLVWICVLPTLTDGTVLKKQRWYHPEVIGLYQPDDHAGHDHKDGKDKAGEKKPAPADPDADAFK